MRMREDMKALVLVEYNNFELKEVPLPKIDPKEVLIKVKACAICGSDIHGMDGSTGRRRPPVIMGHEASGIIEEIGTDVVDHRVGDRVTFDSTIYCQECYFCKKGNVNLCESRMILGVSCKEYNRLGAFAEYISIPEYILDKIPDEVSFEEAAMTEPLSIAVHAVRITNVQKGDTAAVFGAGTIGLLIIQTLKEAGCKPIIAIDIDDYKLSVARKLGADHGLDPEKDDITKTIQDLTGGRGVDVSFEAVGITTTINTAIDSTRKGGSVTLVGNVSPFIEFPLQSVVTREITLYGSCASAGEYGRCLELIVEKKVDVNPLISKVAPLEEGPIWFERLYNREKELFKVILKP